MDRAKEGGRKWDVIRERSREGDIGRGSEEELEAELA